MGEFYDMTAWSLPFLHSMPAWRSSSSLNLIPMNPPMARVPNRSTIGYAIIPGLDGARTAMNLYDKGYKLQLAPEEMKLGSLTLPKGTMFVLAQPNPGLADRNLEDFINCIALPSAYPSQGKQSPGSENMISLKKPEIALLCGTMEAPTQFGPVQFVLTQLLGLKVANLNNRGLDKLDRYTILVAPPGANLDANKIKPWIMAGGCLITIEGGTNMLELPEGKTLGSPIPGALFRAELNPDSWVCYGLPKTLAVPVDGVSAWGSNDSTAVSVASEGKSYLSGWVWPNESEISAKGSAFCHVQSVGKGNVVWFAQDPTNRAMYPGLWGLIMNAVVMGARY